VERDHLLVAGVISNLDIGYEESFWAAPAPAQSFSRPPSPEQQAAAVAVVHRLIQPGQMRVTAEPVRRLADGAVLGYQLRWRLPRLDELPSPDDFWRAAESADLLEALDDALLRAQLEAARLLRPSAILIGLVGYRRSRPGVAGILAKQARLADIPASRIVWQLSEGESMADGAPAMELAFDLRLRGFKVALVGLGETRVRLSDVARVTPELLHIDASLVGAVDSDPGAAALVVAVGEFARRTGAVVVASDIEDRAELEAVTALGVEYGMGGVFGGPQVIHGPGQVEPVRPRVLLDIDGKEVFAKDDPRPAAPVRALPNRARPRPGGAKDVTEELGQAARSLQGEHDPDVILSLAADHLARIVAYDGLAIYQADWDALRFRPVLARSESEPSYVTGVLGHTFAIGTGITGWAFDLGTPQLVNDADAHPAAGHLPGTKSDDESLLLVPLVAGDHRLGILNLVRFRTGAFSPWELTTAGLVGHMTAAAWQNARLYSEQVQHAITDPLTGLLNTRWLRDSGRRELAMAERQKRSIDLMMLDLDKFKLVNDSCGHGAGDAVLREVGAAIHEVVRAEDAAVRYGGEEFVVLLHETGDHGAVRVWRALRSRLAEIPLPDGCALTSVTASVGVSRYPDHGRTMSQLLGAADAAMYAIKRQGGDAMGFA